MVTSTNEPEVSKKTQNAAKMVPPGVPLSFFWQVLEWNLEPEDVSLRPFASEFLVDLVDCD